MFFQLLLFHQVPKGLKKKRGTVKSIRKKKLVLTFFLFVSNKEITNILKKLFQPSQIILVTG